MEGAASLSLCYAVYDSLEADGLQLREISHDEGGEGYLLSAPECDCKEMLPGVLPYPGGSKVSGTEVFAS